MKLLKRGLAAVLIAVLLIGTMSGCASNLANYENTVVATLGDTEIYLDEANFQARLSQYMNELYYYMYGYSVDEIWDAEITTGKTMEDSVKESVMQMLYQNYALAWKAEELGLSLSDEEKEQVKTASADTYEDIVDTLGDWVYMSEERVEEMITVNAMAVKAYQYAIKDTDREVSDEEARQVSIRYIRVTDSDDAEAAEELAYEFYDRIAAGENTEDDLSAMAEDYDNAYDSSNTLGVGSYDNVLEDLSVTLSTGETGIIYDEGYAWYVVYCVDEMDEEATAEEKEDIIADREEEEFERVYAEWLDEFPEFKVRENVWRRIRFDSPVYIVE